LVAGEVDASVEVVEGEGVLGDCAEIKGMKEWEQREIHEVLSAAERTELVVVTAENPTLDANRSLADRQSGGYTWKEGLLFRTRLDEIGQFRRLLCVPKTLREK